MPIPRVPISSPTAAELVDGPTAEDNDYSMSVIRSFTESCKLMVIATRMIDKPWVLGFPASLGVS
jgi:hypothetical protein